MGIKTAVLNGVASIEIANIQKKNAFDERMYAQMAEVLQASSADEQVRSVLIYGQTEFFSVGSDIEEFAKTNFMDACSPIRQFMHALVHFDKPVVAAVNGPAIGIGSAMLLHCDLVYASDTALFAFPFVSLGLVPDFAATYLLPRMGGRVRAYEKLLLAQPFNVQDAADMRLINSVLPEAEVLNYARNIAERFNKLPPQAVRATKKLLRASFKQEVDVAIETEMNAMAECVSGAEVKETINAFLEKRWPDFTQF